MTTKKYLNSLIPPLKGYFVEESTGKKLGEHTGFWQFTIGQRKGIGLAAPEALYVTSIDAATNTVYVGYKDKLFSDKLFLKNVNWNYPINKQKFESMTPFSIREVRNLIRGADILGTVLEAILESLKTAKPSGTITPLELAPLAPSI